VLQGVRKLSRLSRSRRFIEMRELERLITGLATRMLQVCYKGITLRANLPHAKEENLALPFTEAVEP
jgi:hypothetical protein